MKFNSNHSDWNPPQSPSTLVDVDAQVDEVANFVTRWVSMMLELHKTIVINLLHPCCKPFMFATSSSMQKLK
jgi:hypothetical protein